MADTSKPAPVKATMAPAARDPEGVRPAAGPDLEGMSLDELQALKRRVDAALAGAGRKPAEPSFGMSEGTRQELLQREALRDSDPVAADAQVVSSPFTGAPVDGDGSPRERSAKR